MKIPASFTGAYFARGTQSKFLFPKEKPSGLDAYINLFCKYVYTTAGSAVGVAGFVAHSTLSIKCMVKGLFSNNADIKKNMFFQSLRHRNVAIIDFKKIFSTLLPSNNLLFVASFITMTVTLTAFSVSTLGVRILAGAEMGKILFSGLVSLTFGGLSAFEIKLAYSKLRSLLEQQIDNAFKPPLEETKFYFENLLKYNNIVSFKNADINEFDRLRFEKETKYDPEAKALCDFNILRDMNKVTTRCLNYLTEYQNPLPNSNAPKEDYSSALKFQISTIFRRTEFPEIHIS